MPYEYYSYNHLNYLYYFKCYVFLPMLITVKCIIFYIYCMHILSLFNGYRTNLIGYIPAKPVEELGLQALREILARGKLIPLKKETTTVTEGKKSLFDVVVLNGMKEGPIAGHVRFEIGLLTVTNRKNFFMYRW